MSKKFLQDDNKKDSAMRLVFIIFMISSTTLLVIIAALLIKSQLSQSIPTLNFDALLKAITTGSLGGFLAKLGQKYLEVKYKKQQEKEQQQPKQPDPLPQTPEQQQKEPLDYFRSLPDQQLTRNFSLYEFIEAHPTGYKPFIEMNWKYIEAFKIHNAKQLAEWLQWARNLINERYREQNSGTEIPLVITSAYRCLKWEIQQNRSGQSQHVKSLAADWYPKTLTPKLSAKILSELHKEWESTVYGHQGGMALKWPTYDQKGNILKIGYIHIDLGPKRRWTYD